MRLLNHGHWAAEQITAQSQRGLTKRRGDGNVGSLVWRRMVEREVDVQGGSKPSGIKCFAVAWDVGGTVCGHCWSLVLSPLFL